MVKEDGLSIVPGPLVMRVHDILPFRLTNAQQRVLEVIFRDMAAPHPMNRLVQGDVGSGKTIVAFCAALAALDSGYQDGLYGTHGVTRRAAFSYPRGPGKTTRRVDYPAHRGYWPKQKQETYSLIEQGKVEIVVGTHALIQEGIRFHRLG